LISHLDKLKPVEPTTSDNAKTESDTANKKRKESTIVAPGETSLALARIESPSSAAVAAVADAVSSTASTAATTSATPAVLLSPNPNNLEQPFKQMKLSERKARKRLVELKGDLFAVSGRNLAHCISADCSLGKGMLAHIESLVCVVA
jgi:hypothetical protein